MNYDAEVEDLGVEEFYNKSDLERTKEIISDSLKRKYGEGDRNKNVSLSDFVELRKFGYTDLISWIKELGYPGEDISIRMIVCKLISFDNEVTFVIILYTSENEYYIKARLNKYLGCGSICRKTEIGESHHRGSDLPDGNYSKETFEKIKNRIIISELEYIK